MSEGAIERTCFASLKISAFCLKELLGPIRSMSAVDAVDGSSAGIAMCHIAVDVAEQRTSGYGTIQPVVVLPTNGRCQG